MKSAKDGGLKIKRALGITSTACLFTLLSDFANGATIKAFDTHSHFKIDVDPSVTYSIQKIEQKGSLLGIRIFIDSYKESSEVKNILENFKDERTEKIAVQIDPNTSKSVYDIYFKTAAVQKGLEYYDYRSKDNSEVIVDYWFKKGTSLNAVQKAAPVVKKEIFKKISTKLNSKTVLHPAALELTCSIPLNYETDGEFEYNTYHFSFNYKKFFKMKRPDDTYTYPNRTEEVAKENEEETVHYRLAFKLSDEGKFALALRTIDLFRKKYPSSKLIPELSFLKISLFVELSKELKTEFYKREAVDLLSKVYLESPTSEKGKLAQMYLIQDTIEQNQGKAPYAVLQAALQAAENGALTENQFLKQLFKMAAAESLLMLGETDRAEANFQQIIEMNGELASEASVRMGEVYLSKKLPNQAIFKFEEAIANYPEKSNAFSPLWFNMAEAYHRLGRYKESTKYYEKFLSLFPNDKNAWAAEYRIAEHQHMAMKPVSKETSGTELLTVIGLYDSVVNKNPYAVGSFLAHLRNSDCLPKVTDIKDRKFKLRQDFYVSFYKGLNLKSLEDPLLNSAEVQIIADLIQAKFNNKTGQYVEAFAQSQNYNPTKLSKMKLGPSFAKVYDKNAYDLVVSQIAAKKYAEGIESYQKYGNFLSENSKDFNFKLNLSEAFYGLNNYGDAKSILKELLKKLPNESEKLKDKYHYLSARVLNKESHDLSAAIRELQLMSDDSELFFEKYDLLSQFSFENENFKMTVVYCDKIIEKLKGNREKLFEVSMLKLESLMRFESPEKVSAFANEVFMKYGTLTDLKEKQLRLSEIRAQSLYDTGNFKDALGALSFVIENKSDHPRIKEFEFMKAKSLALVGLEKEAKDGFRKLAQTAGDDLWKKSAQAELDQLEWENNIKNQINENKKTGGL